VMCWNQKGKKLFLWCKKKLWKAEAHASKPGRVVFLENYFAITPQHIDLEAFKFHFLKRVKPKIISLFISRNEWKHFKFHSFFSKTTIVMIKFLQNLRIFSILENFSRILEKFQFSISRHFHLTFHFSKTVNKIFISLFTSRKEWIRFSFHSSLLEKSESDFTFHF
jgi:hypothetical protein